MPHFCPEGHEWHFTQERSLMGTPALHFQGPTAISSSTKQQSYFPVTTKTNPSTVPNPVPPLHPERTTSLNNLGPLRTWEPLQHTGKGASGESLAFMIKREHFALNADVMKGACAATSKP